MEENLVGKDEVVTGKQALLNKL